MAEATYTVLMRNISKEFPGVKALKNVTLTVKPGEVKALVGENGAGKSTLIKILTGAYSLESGEIFIHGKKIEKMTPLVSDQLGIAAVYQNMMLANHLTVAENVMMGDMPTRFGFLDKKALFQKTQEILERSGYAEAIRPTDKVGDHRLLRTGWRALRLSLSHR